MSGTQYIYPEDASRYVTIREADVLKIVKTDNGFAIVHNSYGVYELTVAEDNSYTAYTTQYVDLTPADSNSVGVRIYKDSKGDIMVVQLTLPSYQGGTSLYGTTATCEVQDDGSYLFTVSSPSWASGKKYKVVLDEGATSCTITEVTE